VIHKIEICDTAANYQQTIEKLQKEGWIIAMVQYFNNQWIVTCQAEQGSLKQ
jgi:hypothetical protein